MKFKAEKMKPLLWFIPLYIAVLLYLVLPLFPEFTETVFSRGIFPIVSAVVGFIPSLLPFSLTELAVILAVPCVIALIVFFIINIVRAKDRRKNLRRWGKITSLTISSVCLLYMCTHGANFYRLPLSDIMGLDVHERSAEELEEVVIYLADKASEVRENCNSNENGFALSEPMNEMLNEGGEIYSKTYDDCPYFWGTTTEGKPVMLSKYWSYTGIAGMYFPFWCECNINVDLPEFTIPSSMLHELAHARGFAREDECNFISYYVGINSDNPDFVYSAYCLALRMSLNMLFETDYQRFTEACGHISDGVMLDITTLNDYLINHEYIIGENGEQIPNPVTEAANAVNDVFISSQGVEDGTRSYGRMVDLVIADYFMNKK